MTSANVVIGDLQKVVAMTSATEAYLRHM